MSTENIYQAVGDVLESRMAKYEDAPELLDIGAGWGKLIIHLKARFNLSAAACDYHVENFPCDLGVKVKQVNLNEQALPYPDNSFDIVTSSEVVEHVENYRALIREIRRVLKPGGIMVLTTPNVLNMKSRVRYLVSGFFNLFGPLPVKNDKLYSTGGHIMPIPYFFLAHAILDADFNGIEFSIDKQQRTSRFLAVLFWPFVQLGWQRFISRETKRYKTLTEENSNSVFMHNKWDMLVGRTVIVSAVN